MLSTVVQVLQDLAEEMETEYDAHFDQEMPSAESLAIVLAAIRDARQGLAVFYGRVEAGLMSMAGDKRFVVDGLGEVSIKKRTRRTAWRHEELLPAVISRVMDEPETIFDQETGELLPYVTIGQNVATRIRECVSLGAGKVTGLRAIGLQPDEFCVEEQDGYSVMLPPRST